MSKIKVPAKFTPQGYVTVPVTLIGQCRKLDVDAIIDSGFTEEVALPVELAVYLGLTPTGQSHQMIADGSIGSVPVFAGKVKIGDLTLDASFITMGRFVLLGMRFLKKFKVVFSQEEGYAELEYIGEQENTEPVKKVLKVLKAITTTT